jgi:uncharacterized membrane protein
MELWVGMFVVVLVIPLSMIVLGGVFSKRAPAKINLFVGYRTSMAMKNADTWVFAHNYFGKLLLIAGLIVLSFSVGTVPFVVGKSVEFMGIFICALVGVQTAIFLGPIVFTEVALKENFDSNGNRRKKSVIR